MLTRGLTCAVIAAAIAITTAQTSAPPSTIDAADLAWDRGDYVGALRAYLEILDSAGGDAAVEPIALRTGELFQTTELTAEGSGPQPSADGRTVAYPPQMSADGRFATYETGAGAARVTHLVSTSQPSKVIARFQGWGAAFSPDGTRIAFLRAAEVPTAPGSTPAARVMLRETAADREIEIESGAIRKDAVMPANGGVVLFTGSAGATPSQVYSAAGGRAPVALTSDEGNKVLAAVSSTGASALYTVRLPGGGRGGGGASPQATPSFGVISLADGTVSKLQGAAPSFSPDGSAIVYIGREGAEYRVLTAPVTTPFTPTVVRKGPERLDAPSLSADGSRVAYQMMTRDDWEIFVANRDGSDETRLTREIQHDLLPQFAGDGKILAVMGEPRHRRSYLYDAATGTRTRLFHNNTVRTIAPEYSWAISRDGSRVLVSAERDGNTVSPERGVYVIDLTHKVTRADVRARVAANLAAEEALKAKAVAMYAPIAAAVKDVVSGASVARVFGYEKALFDFDSKHISRPGNRLASTYLHDTYKSFGYDPKLQWFESRSALDGRTANVLATLPGTINPELVYVVSSHYDSVAVGPGADDDSSGTAALLEAARLLSKHPQPATIVFASFTGEEAGLLGSREFVRQAVASKMQVVGALNNDMIGWANDHRLDNTIRYSNAGIRDVQHAAAMQFSNLIMYDALYYKGTDAAAYYEAWGDIVGGIGSYPVLGNPHYHQPHDLLETINHQLVTEVAKTTAATLMLLASSPSRLTDLEARSAGGGKAALTWKPSPEKGVTGYLILYGPPQTPEAHKLRVTTPSATLDNAPSGTVVAVKAVNDKGLEGWDWARAVVK